MVILQDGSVSLILKTSAINFDLFSEEEQDATIYAYAALLNSLSFPIEIMIRSQKKDVTAYLELLKQQEAHAYTPTRKKQIKEYRQFIEQLVQERNVLDKKFYVVLTASSLEMGITTPSALPGMPTKPVVFDKYAVLEKAITILQPRRDHLIHQFARIGLFATQLFTQDLIQLFYTIYNPEASEGQKVTDTTHYTSPMVQAEMRTAPPVNGDQALQQAPSAPAPSTPTEGVQPMSGAFPTTPETQTPVPQSEPSSVPSPIPPALASPIPASDLTPPAVPVSPIPSVAALVTPEPATILSSASPTQTSLTQENTPVPLTPPAPSQPVSVPPPPTPTEQPTTHEIFPDQSTMAVQTPLTSDTTTPISIQESSSGLVSDLKPPVPPSETPGSTPTT